MSHFLFQSRQRFHKRMCILLCQLPASLSCIQPGQTLRLMRIIANDCRIAHLLCNAQEGGTWIMPLFQKPQHIDFNRNFLLFQILAEPCHMPLISLLRADIMQQIRVCNIAIATAFQTSNHKIYILPKLCFLCRLMAAVNPLFFQP